MSETFSVRVVDEDGNGVEDAEVFIIWGGLVGASISEQTNSDGWATFPVQRGFGILLPLPVQKVIINNVTVVDDDDGAFRPNEDDTFSFTLP